MFWCTPAVVLRKNVQSLFFLCLYPLSTGCVCNIFFWSLYCCGLRGGRPSLPRVLSINRECSSSTMAVVPTFVTRLSRAYAHHWEGESVTVGPSLRMVCTSWLGAAGNREYDRLMYDCIYTKPVSCWRSAEIKIRVLDTVPKEQATLKHRVESTYVFFFY